MRTSVSWRVVAILCGVLAVVYLLPAVARAEIGTGTITGSIVDSQTGLPIPGVYVDIYGGNGVVAEVLSDDTGHYVFPDVVAASYYLDAMMADETHYQRTFYPGSANYLDAQQITVSADATLNLSPLRMRPYARIVGHLKRRLNGDPVAGVGVSAYKQVSPGVWTAAGGGTADGSGNYVITGLFAGGYHLKSSDSPYWTYVEQMYPDVTGDLWVEPSLGETVTIASEGSTLTVGDMALIKCGSVSLTATDYDTGDPIGGYSMLSARLARTSYWQDWSTAPFGNPLGPCPPGDYRIRTSGLGTDFYAGNTTFAENAQTVTVTDGEDYHFTVQVFRPSSVSGRVTSSETASGVANAHIVAFALQGGEWAPAGVETDADEHGNWSLSAWPGTYRFRFSDPSMAVAPAYFTGGVPSANASDVAVAIESTVTAIDQPLHPDHEAPDTAATVSPANARPGWSNAATATISLSATDQAGGWGVKGTWFSAGSAVPTATYSKPVDITSEGTTTVWFGSTDLGGNVEDTHSVTVRLDHSAPLAAVTVVQSPGEALVSLEASDAYSGVAARVFRIGVASVETTYAAPLHLKVGTHVVGYRAIDLAGNRSAWATATVNVPFVAPALSTPSLSPSKPTHGTSFTISGKIRVADASRKTVSFVIQRKVSGKWKAYATVKATLSAGKTSYSCKTKVSKKGSYQVRAYHAKDSVHLAGYSKWKAFSAK